MAVLKELSQAGIVVCVLCMLSCLGGAAAEEGTVISADDFGTKDQQEWILVGAGWADEGIKKEGRRLIAMDKNREEGKSQWWFEAPKDFLGGDAAHAYNGWLQYTLGHFEYEDIGEGVMPGYDVILTSTRKKFSMGLKGVFKMPEDALSAIYQVRLEETFSPDNGTSYFQLLNGKSAGVRASKHEIVQCLANLASVRIRGSYFKGIEATWLRDISVLEGLADKGGRYPGMTESKEADGGPEYTVINGVKVYGPRTSAPKATGCCSSKTCVGRDRYELIFDRPGCMHTSAITCDATYKSSNAAAIIEGTDLNEGRVFATPESPIPCQTPESTHPSNLCTDGLWGVGTKNQNMGMLSIPISKPFSQDYYLNSVPLICSPATLTVTAHGDLRYVGDSVLVYGEDGTYLGALFSGNLSYIGEGQRPYPVTPNKAHTKCQGRSVRGGLHPDAAGNTKCDNWEPGEEQESSSQASEALPYKDSIVVPASAMLRYSADEQIRFTFKSNRQEGLANTFSGTGGAAPTDMCLKDPSSAGCILNGRVIFRSLRLSFSPGVCMVKKVASDVFESLPIARHNAQPLSVAFNIPVPSGPGGSPSGDASLTAVANVHIDHQVESGSALIQVLTCPSAHASEAAASGINGSAEDQGCILLGDMFGSESVEGLRKTYSSNPMLPDLFYEQRVNHTGTLSISRDILAGLTSKGHLHLILRSNSTGGPMGGDTPYSGGTDMDISIKLSPVSLSYPFMSCYLRSITSGPHIKIYLERPRSYYFAESNVPSASGDVIFTIAAKWGSHSRYSGGTSCTIDGGGACAGNVEGMPKTRIDKDTINDLGTVEVWTDVDSHGTSNECCPNLQSSSITDTLWLASGLLAGCTTGMTLSAVGAGGTGYSALIMSTTDAGEISLVTITNGGSGYTTEPQLVASSASCTCTPQIWTCSSTSREAQAGSDMTTYTHPGACSGACFNVDGSPGICCVPGSAPGSDGGIPVCNPPTSLPGNVAGNLDSCLRPVRSGCEGLPVCSHAATAGTENAIRRQYPDMINQHRQWPHGYSYLQLKAGQDGEHIKNLFLKDYSQYSPQSFYVDTVTIPREVFSRSTSATGVFEFTICTPPGRDVIEIASITLGYPVLNVADAAVSSSGDTIDLTDIPGEHWHGPAPSFVDARWSGAEDVDMQTQATEPYFQQQYFKGNP